MLLAAVRAQLRPHHPHAPAHLALLLRSCSSSSSNSPSSPSSPNKTATWRKLNRIPTSAALNPEINPPIADTSTPAPAPAPTTTTASKSTGSFFPPEIEALYRGNQRFRDAIAASPTPNVLRDLAKQGQRPPFLLLDCSDSRVGEQVIFSAEPGTLFTTGNVANQFHEHDLNSKAVLAYAVEALRVKHVIVMGHYGCGGVAAATLPPPAETGGGGPVDEWISPIRRIYETSQRPEIVRHRERRKLELELKKEGENAVTSPLPHLHDPAFRALVEENVKANVQRIARSAVIQNHYASLAAHPEHTGTGVFIHGWVYDIETGEVADLDVTVGPPGQKVPVTPFPTRT
ncbi:putative carbonic anhydrase [Lyophyllum shimeji]|uniref:Carbonic anhydrase n=1 Tax=Lyophyllum shimeji TaxID=47721 RepID=A0A9P3PLZ0_LYOSH|nr:putative carbonic anhydrase [Lyophyllum shimeji]